MNILVCRCAVYKCVRPPTSTHITPSNFRWVYYAVKFSHVTCARLSDRLIESVNRQTFSHSLFRSLSLSLCVQNPILTISTQASSSFHIFFPMESVSLTQFLASTLILSLDASTPLSLSLSLSQPASFVVCRQCLPFGLQCIFIFAPYLSTPSSVKAVIYHFCFTNSFPHFHLDKCINVKC